MTWCTSLSHSALWGAFFPSLTFYILIVQSSFLYYLSVVQESTFSSSSKNSTSFKYVDGHSISPLLYFLPAMLLLIALTWTGPSVVSGFGHLLFTSFERKMVMFVLVVFILYLLVTLPSLFFSNASSYDFVLTLHHLTTWLSFLFLVSNILSLSFVIEVLTGLITLLLVTSHSPCYHSGYSGAMDSSPNGSAAPMPSTYLFSLLVFFWTSLVTTLTLFLFLLITYVKFLTVDWSLVTLLADYMISFSVSSEISSLSFTWLLGLLCILLKCAMVPFFLWKPTFFKGMALPTLFYYIFVFYFVLFLFFMNFLMGLFSELLFFNLSFLLLALIASAAILPGILYETLNLKAFFAISSIMNSVIVLFMLLNFNSVSLVPCL